MIRPSCTRFPILLLALVLAVGALPATAKEESKIQIRLTDPNAPGNGHGNGIGGGAVRADVHTQLQGNKVILRLRARGLEPNTEYALLCKESEEATESAELVRFTTGGSGSANVTQNLAKADDVEAPADPRGKYLAIADGADTSLEIVGGWLYGEPQNDGPMTKIKELTVLAPNPDAAPSGEVRARYDMRPNGHGTLSIDMRRVPANDYELLVDGVLVAELTPNSAGNAKADFQTKPINGQGAGHAKPHRKKQQLSFDPRRKEILVQLGDGTAMFSGPMLAQIQGLNVCSTVSSETPLEGATGSGSAALEIEADCETAFEVAVSGVAAGSYDLYVGGALVATFEAADDGSGTVTGGVRFDPTPDAADELLLDFEVGSGSLVEVFNAGADPNVDVPVLTGTLL
jgi:hypothetical protein